jgi:poly(A) polymerase
MKKIKNIILESIKEKYAEEYLSNLVKGSKWENYTFICGGYVRDQLLGIDPKDIDLVISLPNGGIEFAKWATQKMGNYKNDSNPVIFKRFGTAKFNLNGITHKGVDLSNIEIETVQSRSEKYTLGSRKPDVNFSDLKSDAERRDTTINSLFKKLTTGEIYDLTGKGLIDLKNGIVRTPLDPDKTFSDDPLRLLRIIRMSVKYNWNIPLYIIKSIKRNAPKLQNISKERIRDELNKMMVTDYPQKAIELMRITGLMRYVAPELLNLYKLQQNKFHKEDAWQHTLTVLKQTQPILIQRLMALFHDIGKFATKTITDTGIHFLQHEKIGAETATQIMRRLNYPEELTQAVRSGVLFHMRLKHGGDEANITDTTLRRMVNELGENLENVLDVIHADNISHSDASSMPNQISKVRERLKTLEIQKKEDLPINGKDILDMGVPKGPMVGKVKDIIKKAVLKNPHLSREEAFILAGKVMATLLRRKEIKEGVIKESVDLPTDLEKEAEIVTKSAIGWIFAPVFSIAYSRLDIKERQQEAAMKGIRKFPEVVKKFHDIAKPGSQKSLRLTVYEHFTWENIKKNSHHIIVTMTKDTRGTTTVKTEPKFGELDGYFYEYGDWAKPDREDPTAHYKRYVDDLERSWEETKKYKDDYIYGFVSSVTECQKWKSLRQPILMIENPLSKTAKKWKLANGDPYVILLPVKSKDGEIPFYFNVVKSQKDIDVKYPDYEFGDPENPYVYMTLVADYITDFKGIDISMVYKKVLTTKHEAIHLQQDIRKKGIQTGLPTDVLNYKRNKMVRGTSSGGKLAPGSIHKDPEDHDDRVIHSFRGVEFKSNELNIVKDFEKMLGENLPRTEWEKGFGLLINDITGKYNNDYEARKKFKEIFKWTIFWNTSLAKRNLEKIFQNDKPKFRQYVKEIYKLLFISNREFSIEPSVAGGGLGTYHTG